MWDYISSVISEETGKPFILKSKSPEIGGDINQSWKVSDGANNYFVKINSADMQPMFKAENVGLKALQNSNGCRVPSAIAYGTFAESSYLVLEYIEMSETGGAFSTLGEKLSIIHQNNQSKFGFVTDNFIGSTPQNNIENENWADFYTQNRLIPQLDLAEKNGYTEVLEVGHQLAEITPTFFKTYQPKPSLLHGDLWGGNVGFDANNLPVIYDPACYYGDREADIAMTELFGRLGNDFYSAYNAAYPLDDGYQVRKNLYNLYHILNHLNLFGGGYETQAYITIKKLLCEIY